MNAYSPSVTPHRIVALAPMEPPRLTRVGRYSCLRDTWLRGFSTLVHAHDGPQDTSSSRVTPSWIDTLTWIFPLWPDRVPGITPTFRASLHRPPKTAPGLTFQTAQI